MTNKKNPANFSWAINLKAISIITYLLTGRGGEARTPNTRFWRPVLYQLNYAPKYGGGADGTRTRDPRRDRPVF